MKTKSHLTHLTHLTLRRHSRGLAFLAPALLALLTDSGAAWAIPIGPTYPPPGGVVFSGSGALSAGDVGGRTFNFSDLDDSAFSALYWGAWSDISTRAGLDYSFHTLSFVGIYGNQAIWQGTSPYQDAYPSHGPGGVGSSTSADVRLVATLLTGSLNWVTAGSLGLYPTLGALVVNPTGADFAVNLQFQADLGYGFGWQAINTVQQLSSGRTQSGFSGGFYYDPPSAAVPDGGSTVAMISGSLLLLGGVGRRLKARGPAAT